MTQLEYDLVSVSEIAKMAGTARSTVSNWKRRHEDFPPERDRNPRGPLFDRGEIAEWLNSRSDRSDSTGPDEPDDLDRRLWSLTDLMRAAWRPEDTLLAATTMLVHHPVDPWLAQSAGADLMNQFEQRVTELAGDTLEQRTDAIDALIELLATSDRADRFVPRHLVHVANGLLGMRETVLDPFCGLGEFLVAAADHARLLCGQDPGSHRVDIARGRLWNVVVGPEAESSVAVGDAIAIDLHPLRFDGVICAPPMGRTLAPEEVSDADPRWVFGHPGASGDAAWIQHALAHLGPGGRAVMVLAPSSISHAGAIGRIRAGLARSGALRAAIQLPARTFASSAVAPVLLVLERPEDAGADRTVLVGEPLPAPPARQIGWPEELGESVITTVNRWLDSGRAPESDRYAVVTLDEAAEQGFNLTPRRYLDRTHLDLRAPEEIRSVAGQAAATLAAGIHTLTGSAETIIDLFPGEQHLAQRLELGQIAEVKRGIPAHTLSSSGEEPVHTPATVFDGTAPNRFLAENAKELQTMAPIYNAMPGDVLVAIEGPIGSAHLVTEPMFVSSGFAILRPHPPDLNNVTEADGLVDGPRPPVVATSFLDAWFATPVFLSDCERYLRNGPAKRITVSDLKSIQVPVPTQEVQTALAELHSRLRAAQRAARELELSVERIRHLAGEATAAALPSRTSQ